MHAGMSYEKPSLGCRHACTFGLIEESNVALLEDLFGFACWAGTAFLYPAYSQPGLTVLRDPSRADALPWGSFRPDEDNLHDMSHMPHALR